MTAPITTPQHLAQDQRKPQENTSSDFGWETPTVEPEPARDPLHQLEDKLAVIRDRVRGVALGHHTGFYLYGRPGTSKTYTVRNALDRENVPYRYHTGHLTQIGFFELLHDNPDEIIVLDDVSQLFKSPIGMQLLLAALGNQSDATGVRVIQYRRQGIVETVRFTRGIIAISNLELHGNEITEAIKNRVHCLNYDPTDEQITALILDIAERGFQFKDRGMSPNECHEVASYLLEECRRLNHRPDVRLLVDKAFKDYLLWRTGDSENHWKDLVTSTIQERATTPRHDTLPRSRKAQVDADQQLVRGIITQHTSRPQQVAAWRQQTGKSERAFYRRLTEMDATLAVTA